MKLRQVEERRWDDKAEDARKRGAGRRGDACECLKAPFGPIPVCWDRKGSPADSGKRGNTSPILSMTGGIVTTMAGSVATMGRRRKAGRSTGSG